MRRTALAGSLVFLSTCAFWSDHPTRIHVVGGDPGWPAQVAEGARAWNSGLRRLGCPPAFIITLDEGHPVILVPSVEWRHPGSDGESYPDGPAQVGRIEVTDRLTGISRHRVLLHELGHAIGLDHSPDPKSIMHSPTSASDLSHDDVAAAARTLRCGVYR